MSPAAAQTETTPLSGGSSLVLTKLNDNGSNWIDYKTRTLIALGSWSLRGYVEGTTVPATRYNKDSSDNFVLDDGITVATSDQIDAREKRVEESEAKEFFAQHIIISSVSPRLVLKLTGLKTAKEMWDTVVGDYEGRSTMYQVDVRRHLHQMSCNEGEDVKAHLTEMNRIRMELSGIGAPVDDKDFVAMIEGSLPKSYRTVISAMMTALQTANDQARNTALRTKTTFTLSTIDPDALIRYVIDEYENRLMLEQGAKGDTALSAVRRPSTLWCESLLIAHFIS
jgi:hypothetical protein